MDTICLSYEAVPPVNLFWLEWKAGKAVVVNLFWWNVPQVESRNETANNPQRVSATDANPSFSKTDQSLEGNLSFAESLKTYQYMATYHHKCKVFENSGKLSVAEYLRTSLHKEESLKTYPHLCEVTFRFLLLIFVRFPFYFYGKLSANDVPSYSKLRQLIGKWNHFSI